DLGRWDEAAKDFSRAIQLSPQEFTSWYRLAYVQLAMGSIDRYRRVCEEMLTRFGRSDDPTTLSNLARALMEARDGQMNFERSLRLGQAAVDKDRNNSYCHFVLGAALYRNGRFAEAIELLREAMKDRSPVGQVLNCYDQLFLAMAHHRLGHASQARDLMKEVA